MSGWIRVDDRLPDDNGLAVVFSTLVGVDVAEFEMSSGKFLDMRQGSWSDDEVDDVTHWMPMPEEPSKEGGDE